MPKPFKESLIERGSNATNIEEGRIFNVDIKRWTVDVMTGDSQKVLLDIRWSNAYLHFAGGEGIFCMPEVGAKVMVCSPADGSSFVLSFVAPHERLDAQPGDDAVDPTAGNVEEEEGKSNVSFRAGRPDLQQGDIMIRTRDGNGIWFRRGGIVEISSTPIAKRVYIPILNYIRDLCENYDLLTAGGNLSWTVARSDESPSGDATALLNILARNNAQDEFGSVAVQIGHVDDTNRLKITVAPNVINPIDLSVTAGEVFTLEINDSGAINSTVADSCTMEIGGDLSLTVTGSATQTFSGGLTQEVTGDIAVTASGNHTLDAVESKESLSAGKVIDAPSIKLGSQGAAKHLLLAEAMLPWILTHTHSHPMAPTGPPVTPPVNPADIMTTKTTAE